MSTTILGIESSCDDTSAAVIRDGYLLSNVIANQQIHVEYGGVVPELASRSHQQNIIPVVEAAVKKSKLNMDEIDAVAFTRGPGLLGSLLVGTSFAKGFSLARQIPLIEVNHLQGHILSLFIQEEGQEKTLPNFPFLCLLVSGGHSQIIVVKNHLEIEIIGQTIDDAAGEAFDKCAKVIGLPYPGGPFVDKLAQSGNPDAIQFSKPKIQGLDYSFSGLKTSFLYHIRDAIKKDENYIENNLADLCASLQKTIVDILMGKLRRAVKETGITEIGLAGGVSANSGLRKTLMEDAEKRHWKLHIPPIKFTTDNAAMIGITGYFKYKSGVFSSQDVSPLARWNI